MASLVVKSDICTGCMNCQVVCALKRSGLHDPEAAAIRVNLHLFSGNHNHTYCRQCEFPRCKEVCPVDAIYKNQTSGGWQVNKNICVGCGECIKACNFGAMFKSRQSVIPFKCDLCQGTPACVEACNFDVITFEG